MFKAEGLVTRFRQGHGKGVVMIPELGAEFEFRLDQVRLLQSDGEVDDQQINPACLRDARKGDKLMVYLYGRGKEFVVKFVVYKKHHDDIFKRLRLAVENEANRDDEDFRPRPREATAVA